MYSTVYLCRLRYVKFFGVDTTKAQIHSLESVYHLAGPPELRFHTVALGVGGVHLETYSTSWLEREWVEHCPTVQWVDLPCLGMLPVSRHLGEHCMLLDASDPGHNCHTMMFEHLDHICSTQEQTDKNQESDKKENACCHDLQPSCGKNVPCHAVYASRGKPANT